MCHDYCTPCSPKRSLATLCAGKSLHKLARELRGLGHKANVTAGQLDKVPTELLGQFDTYAKGRITVRFPPGHRQDPFGMCLECANIEVNCRILPQFVFEPIDRIGSNEFTDVRI